MARRTLLIGLTLFSLAMAANAAAQSLPGSLQTLANPLIGKLTGSLGLSQDQAEGGVGSILTLAQEKLAKGDFDAFLFEMAGRSLSWVYEFWRSHEGSRNNTGYRAADAVLDQIKSVISDEDTRAAVKELDRVLHADPPAVFIAWQETSRAVSAKFDVGAEDNRDVLANLWQWRPAAPPSQASR